MSSIIELQFKLPEFYPAPSNVVHNMRLSLLRRKNYNTATSQYSFETQDQVGKAFRSTRELHLDA